jgi:membrane protease subunit HflK
MTDGSDNITRPLSAKAVLVWLGAVAAFLVLDFLFTGIHSVQENEQGVVLRFGAVNRTVSPGLVLTLPWPVEALEVVNTRETRKMPVGFRFVQGADPTQSSQNENEWLTGDMNVVEVEVMIHYRISKPAEYLFKVGPVVTDFLIRKCTESALTETMGIMSVDAILTTEKFKILEETLREVQALLTKWDAGVEILRASLQRSAPPADVVEAFEDVTNAKNDRNRALQEADGYGRDILPKARAKAEQILQQAKVYESSVLSEARGRAARFKSLYEEYKKVPEITRTRLLLDTMQTILAKPRKIVVTLDQEGRAEVKIIQ